MKFTYPSGSRPLEGFTIKRGVGQGGFGEVYYATSDAGKEVALKLIRRNLEVELRGVTHCLNLKHQNLIGLFDIRTDAQDDGWVVMEYVSGESLEQAIQRNPNGMPVEDALAWFRGIAAGVAYLHDHGIVHRDLKPGNIFLDQEIVKIGDYGLSKFISSSRRSGQTESVGTVHYMAPEVANGRYGKEIDVYALGIILYEMISGRVPFEGESVGEILMKHLTAEPDLTSLAEPYRSAVAAALRKDPDERVGGVQELLAMLPGGNDLPKASPPPVVEAILVDETDTANSLHDEVPTAEIVDQQPDEEPIWKALCQAGANLRTAWSNAPLNPIARTVLLVVGILGLVMTAQVWVPVIGVLAAMYAVYWVIRAVAVSSSSSPSPTPDAPPSVSANAVPPPVVEQAVSSHWHRRKHAGRRLRSLRPEPANAVLLAKSTRERVMELTGSMLMSTLVVVVISIVMLILGEMIYSEQYRPETHAWLALSAVLASWAVLIPAKFWEGRRGEPTMRRFTMLVAGLAVGAAAYGIDTVLLLDLNYTGGGLSRAGGHLPPHFADAGGSPELLAYLAFFGVQFLILRWWLQADPLRPVRLSFWSTALVLFWAGLTPMIPEPWFPSLWGAMLAVTVSIAVQLSSPWIPPAERTDAPNV